MIERAIAICLYVVAFIVIVVFAVWLVRALLG